MPVRLTLLFDDGVPKLTPFKLFEPSTTAAPLLMFVAFPLGPPRPDEPFNPVDTDDTPFTLKPVMLEKRLIALCKSGT